MKKCDSCKCVDHEMHGHHDLEKETHDEHWDKECELHPEHPGCKSYED